jgi:hypothetical protein
MTPMINRDVQAVSSLGLHEVLTGNMAARYGALPMLPLPQDEDLLTKRCVAHR